MLLAAGANPAAQMQKGSTPFRSALINGKAEAARLLAKALGTAAEKESSDGDEAIRAAMTNAAQRIPVFSMPSAPAASSLQTGHPPVSSSAKKRMSEPPRGTPAEAAITRIDLDVPFADKDKAKALGARWDPAQKSWYASPGTDLAPLRAAGFLE